MKKLTKSLLVIIFLFAISISTGYVSYGIYTNDITTKKIEAQNKMMDEFVNHRILALYMTHNGSENFVSFSHSSKYLNSDSTVFETIDDNLGNPNLYYPYDMDNLEWIDNYLIIDYLNNEGEPVHIEQIVNDGDKKELKQVVRSTTIKKLFEENDGLAYQIKEHIITLLNMQGITKDEIQTKQINLNTDDETIINYTYFYPDKVLDVYLDSNSNFLLSIQLIGLSILTLIVFLLINKKNFESMGLVKFVVGIKFELWTLISSLVIVGAATLYFVVYSLADSQFILELSTNLGLTQNVVVISLISIISLIIYTFIMLWAIYIKIVFAKGWRNFFKEHTLIGWFISKSAQVITDKNYAAIFYVAGMVVIFVFGLGATKEYDTFGFMLFWLLYSIFFIGVGLIYLNRNQHDIDLMNEVLSEVETGKFNQSTKQFKLKKYQQMYLKIMNIEDGLSLAIEEEVKSQRMKNELISNVSHDLKTPITGITNYLELLDKTELSEEQKDYILKMNGYNTRLQKLIEDIFTLSKVNSGDIRLEFIPLNIQDMLQQIILEYEPEFTDKQLQMVLNANGDDEVINLDSEKTYRIFDNLMSNISKYSLENTRVFVELEYTPTYHIITIKNISKELLEETDGLNERFVRGEKSRNQEGHGLGLAIVESLIEAQGGKYRIIVDGDMFKIIVALPTSHTVTHSTTNDIDSNDETSNSTQQDLTNEDVIVDAEIEPE